MSRRPTAVSLMVGAALVLAVALLALAAVAVSAAEAPGGGKVLLRDVQALTLHEGRMTNGRRSAPVPQLQRVGGSAPARLAPATVQCTNVGSDGVDAQWRCEAELDKRVRFGSLDVSCEGYASANDPYVLRGSCGLSYTLDWVDPAMRDDGGASASAPHGSPAGSSDFVRSGASYGDTLDYDSHRSSSTWLFAIVIVTIVYFVLFGVSSCCCCHQRQAAPPQNAQPTATNLPPAPPPPPPTTHTAGSQYHPTAPHDDADVPDTGYPKMYPQAPQPSSYAPPPPPPPPPQYAQPPPQYAQPMYNAPPPMYNAPPQYSAGVSPLHAGLVGYMLGRQLHPFGWSSHPSYYGSGSTHVYHHHSSPSTSVFRASPSTSSHSSSSSSSARTASGFASTSRR